MATRRTTTAKRAVAKKPSATEVARREEQSRKDKGDEIIIVTVKGVDVTVDPRLFRDVDFAELSIIASDPDASPRDQMHAAIKSARMTFGEAYDEVCTVLREENGGYLTFDALGEVVAELQEAVLPG